MTTVVLKNIQLAALSGVVVVALLASAYFVVEPQVGRAVNSGPFSIRQEVGQEISFLVEAANVTMAGTLNGLTGGNATGTTQAVVRTNSAGGYYMDISFADSDSDSIIMRRDAGGSSSGSIRNYATTSVPMVVPTYGFSTASTAAMFAYTVTASDTNAIAQNFLNNGSTLCGVGSNTTADICWMQPATTTYRIIDSGDSAPQGSTTTVKFRVYIPSNPNPGVDAGFYTATATLSASNQ